LSSPDAALDKNADTQAASILGGGPAVKPPSPVTATPAPTVEAAPTEEGNPAAATEAAPTEEVNPAAATEAAPTEEGNPAAATDAAPVDTQSTDDDDAPHAAPSAIDGGATT